MSEDFYQILGVTRGCSFTDLKRAYFRQAKQCHPDLFGGEAPEKIVAFQRLVQAFDVLSDPVRRREYDAYLSCHGQSADTQDGRKASSPADAHFYFTDVYGGAMSVMDTLADDILEELVVGNDLPMQATLQTLMLDLAGTERFVAFREAKTWFQQGKFRACLKICSRLVKASPNNILYHFFLAEAASRLRRQRLAVKHYRNCLQIGLGRTPPQRLRRVRRKLQQTLQQRGWLGRLLAKIFAVEAEEPISEEAKSRQVLEDVFAAAAKRQKQQPMQNPGAPKRRLPKMSDKS